MLTILIATEVATMTPVISVPQDYVSGSSTYDDRTLVFVVTMTVILSVIATLCAYPQAAEGSQYEDCAKKHGDHASVSNDSNHLITPFKKYSNCLSYFIRALAFKRNGSN